MNADEHRTQDTSVKGWLAMICAGILLSGVLVALVSSRYFPMSYDRIEVRRGHLLFERRCYSCHAAEIDGAVKFGPSLGKIGQVAARRKPGMDAADYILESILRPEAFRKAGVEGHMPSNTVDDISDDDLRNLVAYLVGLGSTLDYARLLRLDTTDRPVAEKEATGSVAAMRRGWELFSQKLGCSGCHSIYNIPGNNLAAPSLQHAAQSSVDYLRESIRNPDKKLATGYSSVTLTTIAGDTHSGRLISETDDRLVLLSRSSSGAYEQETFDRMALSTIVRSKDSPMPRYELTDEDEAALLAFLKFLRGG